MKNRKTSALFSLILSAGLIGSLLTGCRQEPVLSAEQAAVQTALPAAGPAVSETETTTTVRTEETAVQTEPAAESRITILGSRDGDFLISRGAECMDELLEQYGNQINVIYAHNDAMMYGALDAIQADGRFTPGRDIIVISVDGEQRAIDLLKEGKVNCVVECTPMLGEIIMQAAADLQAGKQLEREIYSQEGVFTEFDDLSALAPRGY